MYFRLIFLGFLGFTPLPSAEVFDQNLNPTVICWSEEVKLTWSDFEGRPDTSTVFKDMLAGTSASIQTFYFEDAGLPNYRISHFFQRQVSWFRDTSALLLLHEQLHFDISELYARRIRKGIDSLRRQKVKDATKYVDLINSEFTERRRKQRLYDVGTHNGAIDILQEEWNMMIRKELNLLKEYETEAEDCKGSGT
ncbi:MAG: hypothetical protein RIB71_22835 [Imperialibacter sp.]|uniref:DUF922 domain-containing protein n=1 Tax=Imperialibacter sp. TaxID=2038411 RepID=UPI0032EC5C7D